MSTVTGPVDLGGGWTGYIYRNWDFPSHVLEDWEGLVREYGDAGVFLGPGWFKEWWSAFGKPGRLFVVALEERGRTQAILPCWTPSRSRVNRKALTNSLTNDHTHHYDFLIRSGRREHALFIFFSLLRRLRSDAGLRVECLSEQSGAGATLNASLRRQGFPYYVYEEGYSPYVDLTSSSWDAYHAGLDSKFKANLRRRRQKAAARGSLSFEVVRQTPSLDDLLTEVFDVEFDSWKGDAGTAIRCQPEVEAFYRGIGRWAEKRGALALHLLRLNGQLIAFNLCLESGQTVFLLKTGYNQREFADISPGILLHYEMLRYFFGERRHRRYVFGGTCTPWKLAWTSSHDTYRWVEVFPRSAAGWLRYGYRYGWKSYLKRFEAVRRLKMWLDEARGHAA